jgi:hypothetical protein
MNLSSIKENPACTHFALYGVVESLAFANRVRTALCKCHQQRLIFGFQTCCKHPISAISWAKIGLMPYLSNTFYFSTDSAGIDWNSRILLESDGIDRN